MRSSASCFPFGHFQQDISRASTTDARHHDLDAGGLVEVIVQNVGILDGRPYFTAQNFILARREAEFKSPTFGQNALKLSFKEGLFLVKISWLRRARLFFICPTSVKRTLLF